MAFILATILLAVCVACGKESANLRGSTDLSNKMLDMPQVKIAPVSPVGEVTIPSYEGEALIEVAKA